MTLMEDLRKAAESKKLTLKVLNVYRPDKLAAVLGLPTDKVDTALQETGYYKAMDIKKELIQHKIGIIDEIKLIHKDLRVLNLKKQQMRNRLKFLEQQLLYVKHILRKDR